MKNKKNSLLTSAFSQPNDQEIAEDKQNHCLEIAKKSRISPSYVHLDFPKRPFWVKETTMEELNSQEELYFENYKQEITDNHDQISFYEQNLRVWQEFWRVLEKSTVILVVCDIRNPLFFFPVPLHDHLNSLGKKMIIVLNKVDLVAPDCVESWLRLTSS